MNELLTGKVALITGAGRGIGRATALLFATEGAQLVLADSGVTVEGNPGSTDDAGVSATVAREVIDRGGTAVAISVDVATEAGADRLVETALQSYGRVDVLINNAGIRDDRPLLSLSADSFRRVTETILNGTFFCMRAAARQMKAQNEGGSIVNTSAIAGLIGNHGQSNYSAATAGVLGLTRTGSIELQRHAITVNAVAPLAKTRMTADLPIFEQVDSMGPEHVAPVHLFLASALGANVTGTVVSVAGAKISTYRLVQSQGLFKEGGAPLSAREIAEHWNVINKG